MRKRLKKLIRKRHEALPAQFEEVGGTPRITNETVAAHREEVLSGARKYIYPLQHSKHRVVLISTGIAIAVLLGFLTFCVVSLYYFQSTSGFLYRVTQVLSLPIARSGRDFIAYENYLFELRHYMHYYENQQDLGFDTETGKQQLQNYKQRAIDKIINDAVIKQIAKEKGISVTDAELDKQFDIARVQNRLGGSDQVFEDVLREYWGWAVKDYRRSLRSEMLAQEVAAALDEEATALANQASAELAAGADFAAVVGAYSTDAESKALGGDFGVVDKSNRNISPQTIDTLFNLGVGQVSKPIIIPYGTGYAYEILKNLEVQGDDVKGAHIIIQLKDINEFLNDRKDQKPVRMYVKPS